jgi:hypothetical protein
MLIDSARPPEMRALASVVAETKPVPTDDAAIRERLYAELRKQPWAPVNLINIVVRNGGVHLWGTLFDERHRGVILDGLDAGDVFRRHANGDMVWVEPMSGMVISMPEEYTPGL